MQTTAAERYGSSHHLANQTVSSIREATVSAEIRDLHSQLQALDDVTGKLLARLEGVFVERPAAAQVDAPAAPIVRCKLAGEIHAAVDLACNVTAKVNTILCGLEL